MKIINAENRILGRVASEIAEKSKDEKVHVINSEDVVISGDKDKIKEKYLNKYERGSKYDGPFFPKRPDKILKRTVRGMLPTNKNQGEEAFSNVRTYIGKPDRFDDVEEAESKSGDDLKNQNYVKLGEVSKHIGWRK